MTTNTSYGSWGSRVRHMLSTVEACVEQALSEWSMADEAAAAITADYRAAINAALPDGVQLCGEEFYGPAGDINLDGYPVTEDGALDLDAIVQGIDFWAIVAKHDTGYQAHAASVQSD